MVCLQEIRGTTVARWREALAGSGLDSITDSSGRSDRKLFNLTATRWPAEAMDPVDLPQPERLLSTAIESDRGPIEVHNLHIPPLRDAEGTRVAMLTGVHDALAGEIRRHRVLCGDLNTARVEFEVPDEEAMGPVARAERLLLRGLEEWDLHDVFRGLHGYGRGAVSRTGPGHHRQRGFRLDHILASRGMNPVFCEYQDGWRREGFSDHSAMEAIFDPIPAP